MPAGTNAAAGYNETTYTVPASNGTPVKIPCTLMSVVRMEIYEVPALASVAVQSNVPAAAYQGLQFQFAAKDGTSTPTTPTFDGKWKVQAQVGLPIVLGPQVQEWKARGRVLGNSKFTDPAGQAIGPDYPIELLSQTLTATIVTVREYVGG